MLHVPAFLDGHHGTGAHWPPFEAPDYSTALHEAAQALSLYTSAPPLDLTSPARPLLPATDWSFDLTTRLSLVSTPATARRHPTPANKQQPPQDRLDLNVANVILVALTLQSQVRLRASRLLLPGLLDPLAAQATP